MLEPQQQELSQGEVRALALEGLVDPVRFCRFFLPDLFPGPIPWIHRGILAILTSKVDFLKRYGELDKILSNFIWKDETETEHNVFTQDKDGNLHMTLGRYTLLMMPRGSAKTTIAGIAIPLYEILYQELPFTVYVSEAAPHAKMQLHNVQRELTDNPRIQGVFGNLRPSLRDDEKWSGDFFETNTGVALCARGRGGQIRGLLHRGRRPEKIICDDLEDKESVDTELQRRKTKEWAYGDLIPALPKISSQGTIVALGTLLHPQSLLATFKEDPQWTVIEFGALDKQGVPIWPVWMDHADLEKEKRSFASAGQIHTFYMEYFNQAVAPEAQVFKPEYFQYNDDVSDIVHTAIYIDPAISPKRTADKTAIVVCGMTEKGVIRVLEVVAKRGMDETEKLDWYFRLSIRWKCRPHGVESIAYQAALVHLIREEMFRRGHYFEITAVTHKTRKTDRIVGILAARFASRYIEFLRRFPDLEAELLDFRQDTDDQIDDCADALAGCVSLLDPFAAQAAGEIDLSDNEYPPLEELFEEGEWRLH